jgi:fatty-acid desaturase
MVFMVAGFHVVLGSLHIYSEWYPWQQVFMLCLVLYTYTVTGIHGSKF